MNLAEQQYCIEHRPLDLTYSDTSSLATVAATATTVIAVTADAAGSEVQR